MSVSRSAGVMALGTIMSRLTGLIRTILFVQLGVGVLTDAYGIANISPNMFYELVVGGVLSATLVPLFVRLLAPVDAGSGRNERDVLRDQSGASAVVTLAVAVIVSMSIALFVGAPLFLSLFGSNHSWPPGQREFAVSLLRMFAPQVALYGCVTLSTAVLHSRSKFGITMAAPILNNVVVSIVFVWVRQRLHQFATTSPLDLNVVRADKQLMWTLGWGTTLGVAAMFLVTIPALRAAKLGLRPVWNPQHGAVKELVRLSGWTMGYVAANQAALWFIYRVAKRGKDGDLTAYTTANSVFFQLPYGVIAVSVMAGIQPVLSRAFANRKRAEFRRQLSLATRSLLVLMTPAAAGYVLLAKPITELVTANGGTTVAKALVIGRVLAALAPGLPAFSVYLLYMNALKAMLDTRATFEVNVIENAINIVVGAVLYRYFGVAGLGAAFAVAYTVAAVIAGFVVSRRTAGIEADKLLITIGRTLVATGVMAVSVLITGRLLVTVLPGAQTVDLTRVSNRLGSLVIFVCVSAAVGIATYFGAARLVGITEFEPIVRRVRALTNRR
jgi:putative peptidoglycan lipid II flippase